MNTKTKALIATLAMSVVGWVADVLWLSPGAPPVDAAPEAAGPGASPSATVAPSANTDDRLIAMRAAVAKHLVDLPAPASGDIVDGFSLPPGWLHGGGVSQTLSADAVLSENDPDAPSVTAIMSGVGAVINGKVVAIGGPIPGGGGEPKSVAGANASGWTLAKVTSEGAILRRPDGRLLLVTPPKSKLENGEMSLNPPSRQPDARRSR